MHSITHCAPAIRARIRVERRIVRRVVTDLIAAGYELSVDDGGYHHFKNGTTDAKTLYRILNETDDDTLYARKPGGRWAFVTFVYGNDGWDVISDYNVSLESDLAGANALSEELSHDR